MTGRLLAQGRPFVRQGSGRTGELIRSCYFVPGGFEGSGGLRQSQPFVAGLG